jgi:hypothetical protein
MSRYLVTVNRIGYSSREVEVIATNVKEAKRSAIITANTIDFREHDAIYSTDGYVKIKGNKCLKK